MKIKAVVIFAIVLAGCSKTSDFPLAEQPKQNQPERCDFGYKSFNQSKRPTVQTSIYRKRPPKGGGSSPITISPAVLLLDFDGHLVSNTSWNIAGEILCAPANLTIEEQEIIYEMVSEDYRPFNMIVTTDEAVFNSAPMNKRMRVIITETWDWYGQAGGTSYIGSFTWNDETPCFVFSSLLGYNIKQIGEAASHEAGHTLGLRHQSLYDESCFKLGEYNPGQGVGEISWAPIMGNSYYRNITTWHNGPNPYGCNNFQDEVSILSAVLGLMPDDHGNTTNTATTVTTNTLGIINNQLDADWFYINNNTERIINVVPFQPSPGIGSNLDLKLKVYGINGLLIEEIDDPMKLSVSKLLPAGRYYISVETTSNIYANKYGMLGEYNILIN